jgi:poly(3-hydroxybutyrate) depolymerase
MMYWAYHSHAVAAQPMRWLARAAAPLLVDPTLGLGGHPPHRQLAAALDTWALGEITHRRPEFGIAEAGGWPVVEEAADRTPFATLLRFAKPGAPAQPKVLLLAPMSGHFATLLRDTVRTMLPDHDVHITDWHSARDVPLRAGRFGLDEYVEHVMRFMRHLGPDAHLVAICQPCVAGLTATAVMAEDDDPCTPASLTLMAGPIDCRISPTTVNQLATTRPIGWFEKNLISRVPPPLPGAGRRVYPGFVQLAAFMNMNPDRHLEAFRNYYQHRVLGEDDKAAVTEAFYKEYMAVADLPAEFYLETVERVFQTFDLPRGELTWRGRKVDPAAIRRTALLTVEGERDDICAPGQTLAAQDLCSKLKPYMRTHYVQAGVGHYGVFSGRRWKNQIYPLVRDTIHVSRWQ